MKTSVQDYIHNRDIDFTIKFLEEEIERRTLNIAHGHWLSPQLDSMYHEIQLLKWSIQKMKIQWQDERR